MKQPITDMSQAKVLLVGCGNIGSYLASQLARMGLGTLMLVDYDRYEAHNIKSQECTPADIGEFKVEALAAKLRLIRPAMEVLTFAQRLENLPWGLLRNFNVVLGAVDSRQARYFINRLCRRLGLPWIDGGVNADTLWARVTLYGVHPQNPCLECGWGTQDYQLLSAAYPCQEAAPNTPTGAPAALGAYVAAVQALECQKLLQQQADCSPDTELVWNLQYRKFYQTRLRPKEDCGFDHQTWNLHPYQQRGLAALISQATELLGHPPEYLTSQFHHWIQRLVCPQCHHLDTVLYILKRLAPMPCPQCHTIMVPSGFHVTAELDLQPYISQDMDLEQMGLCAGDVLSLGNDQQQVHFLWQPPAC